MEGVNVLDTCSIHVCRRRRAHQHADVLQLLARGQVQRELLDVVDNVQLHVLQFVCVDPIALQTGDGRLGLFRTESFAQSGSLDRSTGAPQLDLGALVDSGVKRCHSSVHHGRREKLDGLVRWVIKRHGVVTCVVCIHTIILQGAVFAMDEKRAILLVLKELKVGVGQHTHADKTESRRAFKRIGKLSPALRNSGQHSTGSRRIYWNESGLADSV